MSINAMTRATGPMIGADLLAGWPQVAQDNQVFTAAQVLAYVQANVSFPSTIFLVPQYASPTATAFSVAVRSDAVQPSTWLVLSPTAVFATGTITLDPAPVAGERLQVSTTQTVTALTINGGTKGVIGAPTTVAAGVPFELRFDAVTDLWYRVG